MLQRSSCPEIFHKRPGRSYRTTGLHNKYYPLIERTRRLLSLVSPSECVSAQNGKKCSLPFPCNLTMGLSRVSCALAAGVFPATKALHVSLLPISSGSSAAHMSKAKALDMTLRRSNVVCWTITVTHRSCVYKLSICNIVLIHPQPQTPSA